MFAFNFCRSDTDLENLLERALNLELSWASSSIVLAISRLASSLIAFAQRSSSDWYVFMSESLRLDANCAKVDFCVNFNN